MPNDLAEDPLPAEAETQLPAALAQLTFAPAEFEDRAAVEHALAHLFAPAFDSFEDFEGPDGLAGFADLNAPDDFEMEEPEAPHGWAASVMALPAELDPKLEAELTTLLPLETQKRLERFAHSARRMQSLFGRLLAQRLANLASHAGQSPYLLKELPPEGPQLTDYSGAAVGRFAVAHTEGGVVVLLSRRPMGIDLERAERADRLLLSHKLAGLAEFALGADFGAAVDAAAQVDEALAKEAFLAAWGVFESAQKMNGDDREPANDSPLTDEILRKYARPREVDLRWNPKTLALEAVGADGSAVPQSFLKTPVGLLTILGGRPSKADAALPQPDAVKGPGALEWIEYSPEMLLEELSAHRHAYV